MYPEEPYQLDFNKPCTEESSLNMILFQLFKDSLMTVLHSTFNQQSKQNDEQQNVEINQPQIFINKYQELCSLYISISELTNYMREPSIYIKCRRRREQGAEIELIIQLQQNTTYYKFATPTHHLHYMLMSLQYLDLSCFFLCQL